MPLLTMLFTDVVGSSATKRDVALGRDNKERDQAYLDKVQTPHFALVRETYRAHDGREVCTMGDAFFLTFEDPVQAVRCAMNIQQKLVATPIATPKGPLRLRIGLHSGFPEFFEGSWHGADVDASARVEAAASPDQVLVSARTYELVRHMADAKFYAHGQYALKGIDRTNLWEVAWDNHGPRRTATKSLDEIERRTRLLRISAIAVAAILVVAASAYLYRSYQAGRVIWPSKTRPSIAVMGFKNLGKPEVEWLSIALSEMLSTELGSNDALRTIPPDDVAIARSDLALIIAPTFNDATLAKLRRILHSEYVISGTYVAMGNQPADNIRIDVRVQDAESGETTANFSEEGTLGTLSHVLRNVATDLRSRLGVQDSTTTKQAKPMTALPSDPEALRLYTEGLAKLRTFDALGARDDLEKSVSIEPNLALSHEALARTWQLLGYDQKAKDESKKAVELSADLPPQEQRSVEAHYRELNSEWDQAISIYQALGEVYPDEPNYALDLAHAQTSGGKAQDALATLAKLGSQPQMKDDPRVDYSVALASEFSDAHKEHDAAASAAQKAKQQGSRLLEAHAYWQLCSADSELGQLQDGEAACDASHRAAPFDDDISARNDTVWATIMLAEGKGTEGLEMRRKALDTVRKIGSQKDVVGALQNLGDALDSQGKSDEARKDYDQALELARSIGDKSGSIGVTNSMAGQLFAAGDFIGAEALYGQSLQAAREIGDKRAAAEALLNLGNLQTQLGQLDDAEKNIQEAIQLYTEAGYEMYLPVAMNIRGELYAIRGDLPSARKTFEDSLRLSTKQESASSIASSRAEIAALALDENNPAEAELLARQAADEFASEKQVDQEADARTSLARALLAQDKLPEARAETDRALKLDPHNRPTALALSVINARLKSKEGKESEARKLLEKSMAESAKSKLVGATLEIQLCQAEMEASANPKLALSLLAAVQKDATSKGYRLISSRAQTLRTHLSQP